MPKPSDIQALAQSFNAAAELHGVDYATGEMVRIVREHWERRGCSESRAMEELSRHLLASSSFIVTNGRSPRSAVRQHDLNKEAIGVGVNRVHR